MLQDGLFYIYTYLLFKLFVTFPFGLWLGFFSLFDLFIFIDSGMRFEGEGRFLARRIFLDFQVPERSLYVAPLSLSQGPSRRIGCV